MRAQLLRARLLFVSLLVITSNSPAIAAPFSLPPEAWETTISFGDIYNELKKGNFSNAVQIARDLAVQELRQNLNNGKLIASALPALAKELNKLIDDPNMTEEQKQNKILQLVDASFDPATSPRTGDLGVSLMHSVEFGVTRLEWDEKVDVKSCREVVISSTCDFGGSCAPAGSTAEYTARRTPQYKIVRILNGQETTITTIRGSGQTFINRTSFGLTIGEVAKAALKATFLPTENPLKNLPPDGRVMFYDVYADFRPKGTTLRYRIEGDDSDVVVPFVPCDLKSHRYSSTVVADADGDGKMDYLPASVYQRLLAKKLAFFLPAALTVLD